MAWKTDSGAQVIAALRATGALLFVALLCPVAALAGEPAPRCVAASRPDTLVTLAGRLTLHSFAGPPDYESVEAGDALEHAFILELPRRICLDDGEFADGSERFDRVHVHAMEPHLVRTLQDAVGRQVTVAGRAVGAHTGHHRAPMVLFAGSVAVQESGTDGAEEKPDRRRK
ncbi:MAG: hypothetical protein AB7E60_09125 [Sphingobium sp.]